MINAKGLVNNGLKIAGGGAATASCTNNGRTTWSYNQGVVLGGLAELAAADHDPNLGTVAQKIATAAITHPDERGRHENPDLTRLERCYAAGTHINKRSTISLNSS